MRRRSSRRATSLPSNPTCPASSTTSGARSRAGRPTSTPVPDAIDVERVAQQQSRRIETLVPGAAVSLSGSALPGCVELDQAHPHDLDLVVLVEDVAAAARALRVDYAPLYEEEWRSDWAAFREPGPPQVDIVLTVRGSSGDARHRRAWDLLLADASLRAEYTRLQAAGI